jgi:hypothetical protein
MMQQKQTRDILQELLHEYKEMTVNLLGSGTKEGVVH